MFKKALISLVKSLIALIVLMLIFSETPTDISQMTGSIFGGIYEYASPSSQQRAISTFTETCDTLSPDSGLATMQKLCANETLLKSTKQDCKAYYSMKLSKQEITKAREVCMQIESEEFEPMCQKLNNEIGPNFGKLSSLCGSYKNRQISSKELFSQFISTSINSAKMINLGPFESYSRATAYLKINKQIYFAAIVILLITLYLLIFNINLFLAALAGIMFSISILILLPYYGILIYDKFYGIDTSPVLDTLFSGSINPSSIISIILIATLSIYTDKIVTIGIFFFIIGLAGKIYSFILKRKSKLSAPKASSKKS